MKIFKFKRSIGLFLLLILNLSQIISFGESDLLKNHRVVIDFFHREIQKEANPFIDIYISSSILPAGTVIRNYSGEVARITSPSWLIFIDDLPGANWTHPCRYVLIEAASAKFIVIQSDSPPEFLDKLLLIERHTKKLPREKKEPMEIKKPLPRLRKGQNPERLWAILISGGASASSNYPRYWNDVSEIYKTLVQVYGYLDDHIYVLVSDGLDPAPDKSNGQNSHPDLDGDGDNDIMYSATVANCQLVLSQLASRVKPNDTVFIYSTDHGSSESGWDVLLNMWGETMRDDQLANMMQFVHPKNWIVTMEQCFSGGFVDDLRGENRAISTACSHTEYSWACDTEGEWDEFVYHWTAAVRGKTPSGTPVNADVNGDGVVSMLEAFTYAVNNDSASETPQFSALPEGFGEKISLWGAGPTSQGELEAERPACNCNDHLLINLADLDLANQGTATITATSTTDPSGEILNVDEAVDEPGLFSGYLKTTINAPHAGEIQVVHGDTVNILYLDADDGMGHQNVEVVLSLPVDCHPPTISNVNVPTRYGDSAIIQWKTDELCQSQIEYGKTEQLGNMEFSGSYKKDHSLTLKNLEEGTIYYFDVISIDQAGNITRDNNGGEHYTFITRKTVHLFYDNCDFPVGNWTEGGDGQWERAFPQGLGGGGIFGHPDPSEDHTSGSGQVWGTDLTQDGNYSSNSNSILISKFFDCRNCIQTQLIFWEWLNLSSELFSDDHAIVEVSKNGIQWIEVFNTNTGADQSWRERRIDLSQWADGQPSIKIRFRLTSDGWFENSGWNIDDVSIKCYVEPTISPTATKTSTPTPTSIPPTFTPTMPTVHPSLTPTFTPTPTITPSGYPTFTPSPTSTPSPSPIWPGILIGGYFDTRIDKTGGILTLIAISESKKGFDAIDILFQGSSTGLLIYDVDMDGVFLFGPVILPPGQNPAKFLLEMRAIKGSNPVGTTWPYLLVK